MKNKGEALPSITETRIQKKQNPVVSLLWILIIVLLFLISSRLYFRFDMTKNKTNTLSEYSRALCLGLDEPVNITYFISGRLDQSSPLPGEIGDLLDEYASCSGGRIRFVKKDPERSGADELNIMGVSPHQMMTEENNESALAAVYSAITIEYLDRFEVLPWVFSLDTLEFDLSSRLLSMTGDDEWELGVIAAEASKEWESSYAVLNMALETAGFTVRPLAAGDEIPPNIKVLFVLGGSGELDEWALYRIDHFIQRGGAVLFAMDTLSVDYEVDFSVRVLSDRGLAAMLAAYGVVIREALVLEKPGLRLGYSLPENGTDEIKTISYPHWLDLSARNGNPSHLLSSRFSGLDLYWASPLELYPPPAVEAVPLFSSGNEAWLQTGNFTVQPDMLSFFEEEANETKGVKILGAALEGIFPSAFDGMPKPFREGSSVELPDKISAPAASRILVVGDTDFAGALTGITGAEKTNTDFLVGAAVWLAGYDGLAEIRNRAESGGRLDRITDVAKRNSAMNFSLVFNVVILPVLVILVGAVIILVGRRR